MVKRILAGACVGWAAIVGLAWWLAHMRIELCHKASYSAEANCAVRATAARDHVLTSGLTVALVGAVAATVAWSVVRPRNADRQAVIQPRSIPPEGDGLMVRPEPASPSFAWRARLPRRGIVLAMVFGMCLAASLLWWGGMVRPSAPPTWQAGSVPASAPNSYADIPPGRPPASGEKWTGEAVKPHVRLIPVEGNPFAAPAPRESRLIPVEGDPFAAAPPDRAPPKTGASAD